MFFDFVGRQKVITVQELDELARRQSDAGIPRAALADIGLPHVADSDTKKPLHFSGSVVRGKIVHDDDFDGLIGLVQSALNGEFQIRPIVEGDDNNRDEAG